MLSEIEKRSEFTDLEIKKSFIPSLPKFCYTIHFGVFPQDVTAQFILSRAGLLQHTRILTQLA